MSTVAVDNIQPSAGGTSFSINGVGRAFANYDQAVPTVRKSTNVSSATDNSIGDATINFTNSFTDTQYCMVGGGGSADRTSAQTGIDVEEGNAAPTTAGYSYWTKGGTVLNDLDGGGTAYFGDLA